MLCYDVVNEDYNTVKGEDVQLNELILSNDLNTITSEINGYKNMIGQGIFEIGRRLKHIKERDLVHGEWENYCLNEVDITPAYANRHIKVYEEFGDSNQYTSIGLSQLYQIATLPEEEREKEHTTSKGETKTVDEMTVRELQEVKKQLKASKEQLEQSKRSEEITLNKLEKLESAEPTTIEKEVITEIDNTDYEKVETLNQQIIKKQRSYDLLLAERDALSVKMNSLEEENSDFSRTKSQIEQLTRKKDNIGRQMESITNISGLVVEIDHFLKSKLAPIKYSSAIKEAQHEDIVINNLSDIIDSVRFWCDDMSNYLPNERKTINVEVIDYEEE